MKTKNAQHSSSHQALALRIETGSDIRITTPVYEDVYVFAGSIQFDAPMDLFSTTCGYSGGAGLPFQ